MRTQNFAGYQTPGSLIAAALVVFTAAGCSGQGVVTEGDWPVITGNLLGQRYSTLDQINADNFTDLEAAWVWEGDAYPSVNARA